jgi:hypothetical protein
VRLAVWSIILASIAVGLALLLLNSTGYVVIFSGRSASSCR